MMEEDTPLAHPYDAIHNFGLVWFVYYFVDVRGPVKSIEDPSIISARILRRFEFLHDGF
jgi:hypothetical protein